MNLEIQKADGSSFTDIFVIFQETEFYSVPEDKIWKLNVFFSLCVWGKDLMRPITHLAAISV
jgi:hypothetical protein